MKTQIGTYYFETARREDGTYVSTCLGPVKEDNDEPILPSGGLLAVFPSASGNDPHYVQYKPGLGVYCTCIGYGYRRWCRYTKFINQLVNTGETTLEALLKQPIRYKEVLKWM